MTFHSARWAVAVVVLAFVNGQEVGAQLMSTCAENAPERRGETGCSVLETKRLPSGLEAPVSGTSIASTHWNVRGRQFGKKASRSKRPAQRGSRRLNQRHRTITA